MRRTAWGQILVLVVIFYTCIPLSQSFNTFKTFWILCVLWNANFRSEWQKITILANSASFIIFDIENNSNICFLPKDLMKWEEILYKILWSPWCQYYALVCNYIYLFAPVGIFYYYINLYLFTFLVFLIHTHTYNDQLFNTKYIALIEKKCLSSDLFIINHDSSISNFSVVVST